MRNVVKKRANIRKVVIFAYALRTFFNRSVEDLEKRFVFLCCVLYHQFPIGAGPGIS